MNIWRCRLCGAVFADGNNADDLDDTNGHYCDKPPRVDGAGVDLSKAWHGQVVGVADYVGFVVDPNSLPKLPAP